MKINKLTAQVVDRDYLLFFDGKPVGSYEIAKLPNDTLIVWDSRTCTFIDGKSLLELAEKTQNSLRTIALTMRMYPILSTIGGKCVFYNISNTQQGGDATRSKT